MLLQPYPKVRVAAAETLFIIREIPELKSVDWSGDVKVLRGVVDEFKQKGIL